METISVQAAVQAAMDYAARGWRVVVVHGMRASGHCDCGRAGCRSPGKHPRMRSWQTEATTDDEKIAEQFSENSNVGVQLGPLSGIIDVECDSPEASAALLDLFGGEIPACPTFAAKRGSHRLFKWRDDLPPDAVVKPLGIEFRLGGGDKGAQSIFPPSIHASGARYSWIPGLTPDDVDPPQLPDRVMAAIYNLSVGDVPSSKKAAKSPEHWDRIIGGVAEGGRNDAAASFIGKLISDLANVHDGQAVRRVWSLVEAWNEKNQPPLDDEELRQVFGNIVKRHQKKKTDENLTEHVEAESSWSMPLHGWRMQIVDSVPRMYRIAGPLWGGETVEVDIDTLFNAREFRKAIFAQTSIWVSGAFDAQWAGDKKVKSLAKQLSETAEHVPAPPEAKRDAVVAAALYDALTANPVNLDDGREPSRSGHPHRMESGEITFRFGAVWEPMRQRADKILRPELSAVLGNRAFVPAIGFATYGKDRQRWHVMTLGQLEILRRLAEG